MKETEKLKLKLPENSDWADIVALNDNFQALDSWLEQLKSDIIAKLNDTPAKEHTHTKKDITDFPTSLPASDVHEWAKQPNKPAYTASEVGAAASSHSHPVGDITGVLPVSKGGTGQTSLAALMSAMGAGKIVAGTYTGNGNESMTINLGFTPRAVIITYGGAFDASSYGTYGIIRSGMAVTGYDYVSRTNHKIITLTTGGFCVYENMQNNPYNNNVYGYTNGSGEKYSYIAFV